MSSVLKRIRLKAATSERQKARRERRKQALGFDAERRVLFEQLKAHADECNEPDPVRFLVHLRQAKRGYDASHDGKSALMQLVDDIDALDAREREWAKGRLSPKERERLENETS